jgi:hypothetical protein
MVVPNWMGILNATKPEERPSVVIRGVLENAREQLTTVGERDSPICRRLTCGYRLRGYVQHVHIFVDEYRRKLSNRTSGIATQPSLFSKRLNVRLPDGGAREGSQPRLSSLRSVDAAMKWNSIGMDVHF